MIRGVTVTVLRPGEPAVSRLGNNVPGADTEEAVPGVLVSPGAAADMEAVRPEGVTVAFTIHFPKGYTRNLEGCRVRLPQPWGGTYRVVGNPMPYMDENTPGRWNRPVMVEEAHG